MPGRVDVMNWLGDVLILAHRTAYSGCGAERDSCRAVLCQTSNSTDGREAVIEV